MSRKTFKQFLEESPAKKDDKFRAMMNAVTDKGSQQDWDKNKGKGLGYLTGSEEYAKLYDMGIKFAEKPHGWDELDDQKTVTQAEIDKAEKAIGVQFKVYTADKVFGSDKKPRGPMVDADLPEEPIVIIHFKDGTRYLVDTTMANSYIRMWAKIV